MSTTPLVGSIAYTNFGVVDAIADDGEISHLFGLDAIAASTTENDVLIASVTPVDEPTTIYADDGSSIGGYLASYALSGRQYWMSSFGDTFVGANMSGVYSQNEIGQVDFTAANGSAEGSLDGTSYPDAGFITRPTTGLYAISVDEQAVVIATTDASGTQTSARALAAHEFAPCLGSLPCVAATATTTGLAIAGAFMGASLDFGDVQLASVGSGSEITTGFVAELDGNTTTVAVAFPFPAQMPIDLVAASADQLFIAGSYTADAFGFGAPVSGSDAYIAAFSSTGLVHATRITSPGQVTVNAIYPGPDHTVWAAIWTGPPSYTPDSPVELTIGSAVFPNPPHVARTYLVNLQP